VPVKRGVASAQVAAPHELEGDAGAPRDIRARRPALDAALLLGRVRRAASATTLVAIDVCGVALAMYAGLATQRVYRDLPVLPGVLWQALVDWLPFVGLIVVLVFARNGLYRSREARPGATRVLSSLIVVAVVTALFALATDNQFRTFGIFAVTFVYAAIVVVALRASYDSLALTLMRSVGMKRRTVLAGRAGQLAGLRETLETGSRGPDVEVVGAVTEEGIDVQLDGIPNLGTIADLPEIVSRSGPDDVIVAGIELSDALLLELVERCRESGARLRLVPTTTELLLRRMSYVPGQAVPLLELRPPMLTGVDFATKRAFDVIVSFLLLIVLSPLLALCALAVRLTSAGDVIFRDRRVGVGEREFAMLKFRSMYADAAAMQDALESLNEADGAIFKIRDDPRVTRVGRVLRRFSLDELPQLVNVLRGEMSLVGPRPLPLRDYQLLEPWHRKRYLVLPGITGLWQTSGRSNLSFDDLVRLDFYYFENWSLGLDLSILLRTPVAVLRGKGAY
jgi:exopolysaccharide biosynthesis polyprenyl glycosylphosphotransferase